MNNLIKAWEKSGRTQDSIAKELDINFTTVCRAINEPWRASWETFVRVADAIGMPDTAAREIWKISKRAHAEKLIQAKYA